MQEKTKEESAIARLMDVPGIATQRGWKAWEAIFDNISVSYARPNPSTNYQYLLKMKDEKLPLPSWHASSPDMKHLCENMVGQYGLQDAVNSTEWTVKEIPIFLN